MTTWNAADKVGVTLSGGDLIATSTGAPSGVRSTTSIAAGKVAFSAVVTGFDATQAYVGVSKAGAAYDGSDVDSCVLLHQSGFGYFALNDGNIVAGFDSSSPAPTGTDTIVVLLDSSGKLYFQCNGNTLFGADPAAGTGGITISTGAYFATASFGASARSATADFTPGSLPSGYSDWDGGGGPVDITGTMAVTVPVPTVSIAAVETPVWSYIGKTETAVDASGDYTLSEPANVAEDDVLVVEFSIRSNVLHANADWQFPQSDASGNTTNNTTGSIVSYQAGYCFRGSSPPSYVFTKTGGSRCLATVLAYRSSRPGTPVFDTSAELAMGSAGTGLTLSGGVTTAEADELVVSAVHGARAITVSAMDGATEVTGASGSTDTTTPPTLGTWIERSDRNNGTSPTVGLAVFDTVKPSAGSTGDLTATASSSARHGMTVMAFKHPALAGASVVPQVVHHRKMQGMQ